MQKMNTKWGWIDLLLKGKKSHPQAYDWLTLSETALWYWLDWWLSLATTNGQGFRRPSPPRRGGISPNPSPLQPLPPRARVEPETGYDPEPPQVADRRFQDYYYDSDDMEQPDCTLNFSSLKQDVGTCSNNPSSFWELDIRHKTHWHFDPWHFFTL